MSFHDFETDIFYESFINFERLHINHWLIWGDIELGYLRGALQYGNYHDFKDNLYFALLILVWVLSIFVGIWDAAVEVHSNQRW